MNPSSVSQKWRTAGWIIAATAIVIAVYAWAGPGAGRPLTTRSAELYYAALADALLDGQLHLKITPDPRLLQLEKPWQAMDDGIPRLPEASYHEGKYYLYFSPLPALLLYMPMRQLFGVFPTDYLAIFIFTLAAWAVGSGVLVWTWCRWFPRLSRAWLAMGILLFAFCTRAIFLLQLHLPHNVPVACAFWCGMMAVAGVAWTAVQHRPLWRYVGLAGVSLAWAGAVACRPNLLFSLPVVGLLWWHLLRNPRNASSGKGDGFWRLTACAILPAAAVGLALALYNHARFGNITEFGVRYHVGSIDQEGLKFFGWENLLPNWLLFALDFPPAPHFSAYFPFFIGWSDYWGFLWSTPVLLLGAVLPFILARPTADARDRTWTTVVLTLAGAAVLNGLSIMLLTLVVGVAERYVIDFLPFALLLAIVVAFSLLERARAGQIATRPALRRIIRSLAFVTTAIALANAGLAIFMRSDPVWRLPSLAQAANTAVAHLEESRGVHHGPMILRLRFHNFEVGTREPLLVTGNGRDIVYVDYVAPDQIRLGLDHLGSINLASDPVPIRAGEEHVVELDVGSLYPPLEHPFFAETPVRLARALRHRLTLRFDGTTVLQLGCPFYPTHAGDRFVGHAGPTRPGRFSGTILAVDRPGLPPAAEQTGPALRTPLRLTLTFAPFVTRHRQPLLSTGSIDAGNVIFVDYIGPNQLRLGYDSRGGGAVESNLIDYTPGDPVTIDIDLPALDPAFAASAMATLKVRFADQLVLFNEVWVHPSHPYEVFLGSNSVNSSHVGLLFQGRILGVEPLPESIKRAKPPITRGTGEVRFTLKFPDNATGRREPLLVTGRPGAADAIYVHYVDEHHIRIGHDHWGTSGTLSDLIPIDYTAIHVINLRVGSLDSPSPEVSGTPDLPDSERKARESKLRVEINDIVVLDEPALFYPPREDEISLGRNAISLSTCGPHFTGTIIHTETASSHPVRD